MRLPGVGGDQLANRAGRDDRPVIDDRDAIAQRLDLLHVVGRVEHRHAVGAERAHGLEDVVAALRIDADGRLVEDQQLGAVEQAGGEVEPPLHAARVVLDQIARALAQPDDVERPADPLGEQRAARARTARRSSAGSGSAVSSS